MPFDGVAALRFDGFRRDRDRGEPDDDDDDEEEDDDDDDDDDDDARRRRRAGRRSRERLRRLRGGGSGLLGRLDSSASVPAKKSITLPWTFHLSRQGLWSRRFRCSWNVCVMS